MAFTDAAFGACSAWAWAVHRAVDALLSQPEVQADGIALTGHSRGGKCALLAGVTDERIAVVNPNNSGVGGASLNRLKQVRKPPSRSHFIPKTINLPRQARDKLRRS